MNLSMTCPACGKQFRNIKPELAGKKVRCGCGAVLRVGKLANSSTARLQPSGNQPNRPNSTKRKSNVTKSNVLVNDEASQPAQNPASSDLLSVDLLGDEMLGDELVGLSLESPLKSDGQSSQRRNVVEAPSPSPAKPKSVKPKTTGPKTTGPSRAKLKPASPKPTTPKPNTPKTPEENADRPTVEQQKKKKHRPPVPVAETSVVHDGQPVFVSTYDDLDSILEGAGDASPVVARTEPNPVAQSESTNAVGETAEVEAKKSLPLGFFAALGSATLAFWFGTFVMLCRFQVIKGFLLNTCCTAIQTMNRGSFETGEITETMSLVFVCLGWALWVLAATLVIFAVVQFADALVKLIFGRLLFSWADGLTAAAAITTVFVIIAVLFTQSTYVSQLHRELDEYERPAVQEGEHLPNVDRRREEIDDEANAFRYSMIGGAMMPTCVFVLSMVRLFVLTSEEKSKPLKTVIH